MDQLKQFERLINKVLSDKGYPLHEWEELDGFTMQDDTFIQAAIVVRDELGELSKLG